MTLDLFTFISGDTADYAEYLKSTSERYLSGKHKINWLCVESLDVVRMPDGYKCVGKSGGKNEISPMKHALAIEVALKNITSDYVLLVDNDVVILYQDWDDVIINELMNHDCFGGAYFNGKNKRWKRRYKKFPSANFFSFRSEILKEIKLDFRPSEVIGKEKHPVHIVKNTREAEVFGIPKGQEIRCDIGWKLPLIFYKNNLSSSYMPMVLVTNNNSKLPFKNKEHEKFCKSKSFCMNEWFYKGQLFATHKKLGRYGSLSSKWGQAWKTRIDLYEKQMYKKVE